MKTKAVHFKIKRAEGPIAECMTREATTWTDADNILRHWSKTAPDSGGYDKCDFTVTREEVIKAVSYLTPYQVKSGLWKE